MSFEFSKGKYGMGQAVFSGIFERISDDIDFVGREKVFREQAIHFVVDGVFYGVWIDLNADSTGQLTFETISSMVGKKVERYGWTRRNRSNCTVVMYRDNAEWVLYFFQPGEIIDLVRKFSSNTKRFKSYGTDSEIVLVPITHLSHKFPVRIPVIGEPNVSDIKQIHEYIKTYSR